jgi:hypothetical protein
MNPGLAANDRRHDRRGVQIQLPDRGHCDESDCDAKCYSKCRKDEPRAHVPASLIRSPPNKHLAMHRRRSTEAGRKLLKKCMPTYVEPLPERPLTAPEGGTETVSLNC